MGTVSSEGGVKVARREERHPYHARVSASWDGGTGVFETRGVVTDLSQSGVGVILPQPLALSTIVTVQVSELRLRARGTIRYCRKAAKGFRIGVELTGGSWRV